MASDSNYYTSPKERLLDPSINLDEAAPIMYERDGFDAPDYQDIQEKNSSRYAPKDYLSIALIIFFIQGMGVLFPWNAFISAPDYFYAIYGKDALLYFGICYSIPNILSLAFMTVFGKKVPLLLLAEPPYIVMFLALVAMPIMIATGFAPLMPYGFIVTLALIVVCGFLTAAVQGGVFGFAGIMPGKYMTAVMSGNGVAGLFVAVLRMITKLAIERHDTTEEQKLSVIVFFSVASLVLVVCILTFVVLLKFPIVKYYLSLANEESKDEDNLEEDDEIDNILRGTTENLHGGAYDEDEDAIIVPKTDKTPSVITVFKKIWIQAFEVLFTFSITLAIFPGLCLAIPSQYPDSFMAKGWFPIFMVFQFNFWDTLGRTAPMLSDTVNRFVYKIIHVPLLARGAFLPLFCLCLRPPLAFFGNDFFALGLMLFMAFSNGYFSSLLMMFAPGKVDDHEKRLAGTMMTFFLVGGIVVGSNSGMLIGKLIGI